MHACVSSRVVHLSGHGREDLAAGALAARPARPEVASRDVEGVPDDTAQ